MKPEPSSLNPAGLTPVAIIDAIGGADKVAALCMCTRTAVYHWKTEGRIPNKALRILRLARPKVFRQLEAEAAAQ